MTRWALVLISVAVAYGCTTHTVVPPAPITPFPTATPTPAPTDPPTASADPSPSLEHPTGATDVVLRMTEYEGMAPYPGRPLEMPPIFTLYGDGRAIYATRRDLPPPGERLELRQANLSDDQMNQLLADALGPGGLATARLQYADIPTTDQRTTLFDIDAGGVNRTISVYALDSVGLGVADAIARRGFQALAAYLANFANDVAAGNATDAGVFEPALYAARLDVPNPDIEPTALWPWPDLEPASFERTSGGGLVGTASAQQANVVLDGELPGYFIAIGPDEIVYVIHLRPLLPDDPRMLIVPD